MGDIIPGTHLRTRPGPGRGFAALIDRPAEPETFRYPAIPKLRGLDIFVSGVVLASTSPWSTATVLPYVRLGIR